MEKQYLVARLEKANGKSVFVASDETLDRSNEVVPMDAWDLKNYGKNPVLLVDHDYLVENIVGLATNISTEGGRLTFEPLLHKLTPLSQTVSDMIDAGFLNAVSVGFLPHAADKPGGKGSNELLEISFVAVGANPNALRLNSFKSVKLDEKKKNDIQRWITKQNEVLELQCITFDKKDFKDVESVETWLNENKYAKVSIDELDNSFLAKYFEQEKCAEGSRKEIDLGEGVKMFACRTGNRSVDERANELKGKLEEETGSKINLTIKDVQETIALADLAAHLDFIIKYFKNNGVNTETIDKLTNALTVIMDVVKDQAELGQKAISVKEGRVLSGANRKKIEDAVSVMEQAQSALEDILSLSEPKKELGEQSRETKVAPAESKSHGRVDSRVVRVLQRLNKDSNLLLRELKR